MPNSAAQRMVTGFQGGSHILKPLKWYASLHTAKGREASRAFLVEGSRAIKQIALAAPERIIEIIHARSMEKIKGIDRPWRMVTAEQYKQVGLSQHPAGPLAVVTIPEDAGSDDPPASPGKKIVILEDIQDPGNMGALIRNAAAFDFDGILCSDKCADPFSPKATQASCGAIVSVWLRRSSRFRDGIRKLKERGYRIIAADSEGQALRGVFATPEKTAIILGNEGNGISAETLRLADDVVTIPINVSKVESLNVATAGAIIMYLSNHPPA